MTDLAPPRAPALHARSVGEILDASFTLYRRHFGALAVIALACGAVPSAVDVYLDATGVTWVSLLLKLANLVAALVLNAIATGATVFVVSESYLGRDIAAGEGLRRALPFVGRIIACTILMTIAIVLGFVFLIVPGFVAICGLVLATPALVLEPGQTASGALSRSWNLTKGARWRIFGLLVTGLVLVIVPVLAIEGVAFLILPKAVEAASEASPAVTALVSLIMLLVTPLISCIVTVAYYDLRVRAEGFDLELLASSVQPA